MYLISRSYTNAASGFRPGVKVFLLCYILLNSSPVHPHSYTPQVPTQPGIYRAANPMHWDRLHANRKAINLDAIIRIPEMHYNQNGQNQQYQSWRQFTPTYRQFYPNGPMDVQTRQHQHSQHQEHYDYGQHSMHDDAPTLAAHTHQEHSGTSGHGHGHSPTSRQDELEQQINQFLAVMGPGLFLLPGTLMLIPFAIPALPLVLLRSYLFPESEEGKKPESEGEVGGHGGHGGHTGELAFTPAKKAITR